MTPIAPFSSIESLAESVVESAKLMDRRLYPRPWNWRERETTHWYLNPNSEWPAFRYGKAMLRSRGHNPDMQTADVVSCFYIERGPSEKVASAYPNLHRRGLLWHKDWLWSEFLAAMAAGSITPIADRVAQESGEPVLLDISVSTVTDSAPEEQVSNAWELNGFVRFEIDGGRLTVVQQRLGDFLRPLSATERLTQIPNVLVNASFDWVWIDLQIGVEIDLKAGADRLPGAWSDADVWKRTLRPWLEWMR